MAKAILLIDDSAGGLSELQQALAQAGYAPTRSDEAEDPVLRFSLLHPELVFVNISRPYTKEICEGIRSDMDGATVPIILAGTNHPQIRSASDALVVGADYYFPLPLDLQRTIAKVQTYIGRGDSAASAGAAALPPPPSFDWPKTGAKNEVAKASDQLLSQINSLEAEAEQQAQEEIARLQAENAKRLAAAEAKARAAETEARRKAEEEAKARAAEAEARRKAEEEAKTRAAEAEARRKAEEEAKARAAEAEIRGQQEEQARLLAEENARLTAEAKEKSARENQSASEEAKRRAKLEARTKAEEATRLRVAQETQARNENENRRKEEEEARIIAAYEARKQAEAEAKLKAQKLASFADAKTSSAFTAAGDGNPPEDDIRLLAEETWRMVQDSVAGASTSGHSEGAKRPLPEPAAPLERPPARETPAAVNLSPPPKAASRALGSALVPCRPEEGNFGAGRDIAALLFEFTEQQITGRVDFNTQALQKTLFFERGMPVDAYSSQVYDRMEEYLFREGKITRAQYQDVRVKALRGPRRIGAYLAATGALKPQELFVCVRGHLEEVVYGLFEWEEGGYHYLPERAGEDDRVVLDLQPRALIIEGIRRKYLLQRLIKIIGGPSSLLALSEGAVVDGDVLHLQTEERQIIRLLDGTRTIEDLVFTSGVEDIRVYQVLAALSAQKLVRVLVQGVDGLGQGGVSTGDAIDRTRILEKLDHVRQVDYFQILGVSKTATPYEIDRAYDRNRREFDIRQFSNDVREQLHEQLLEIESVLADAREVLRNEALRDAYSRHLQ